MISDRLLAGNPRHRQLRARATASVKRARAAGSSGVAGRARRRGAGAGGRLSSPASPAPIIAICARAQPGQIGAGGRPAPVAAAPGPGNCRNSRCWRARRRWRRHRCSGRGPVHGRDDLGRQQSDALQQGLHHVGPGRVQPHAEPKPGGIAVPIGAPRGRTAPARRPGRAPGPRGRRSFRSRRIRRRDRGRAPS